MSDKKTRQQDQTDGWGRSFVSNKRRLAQGVEGESADGLGVRESSEEG